MKPEVKSRSFNDRAHPSLRNIMLYPLQRLRSVFNFLLHLPSQSLSPALPAAMESSVQDLPTQVFMCSFFLSDGDTDYDSLLPLAFT